MPVFQAASFYEEIGPLRLHSDPTKEARQAHTASTGSGRTMWLMLKSMEHKGFCQQYGVQQGQVLDSHLEQGNPGCMNKLGNEKLESSYGEGPEGPG